MAKPSSSSSPAPTPELLATPLGDLTLNVGRIPTRGLSPLAVKLLCGLLVMQVRSGKAEALANLERAAPRLRRYVTRSGTVREPRLRPLAIRRQRHRDRRNRRATLRRSPARSPGPRQDDDADLDDPEAVA